MLRNSIRGLRLVSARQKELHLVGNITIFQARILHCNAVVALRAVFEAVGRCHGVVGRLALVRAFDAYKHMH